MNGVSVELRRLGLVGQEKPAVVSEGVTYRLGDLTEEIDGDFLAGDGIARVREALAAGELPAWEGAEAERVGAPSPARRPCCASARTMPRTPRSPGRSRPR